MFSVDSVCPIHIVVWLFSLIESFRIFVKRVKAGRKPGSVHCSRTVGDHLSGTAVTDGLWRRI